jgi:tRNA threonylcarbamoyl adenosine modification protein (Sua5/YciO/YrdC/YwlC family)
MAILGNFTDTAKYQQKIIHPNKLATHKNIPIFVILRVTEMLIKIYPDNPSERHLRQVVDILKQGGIVVFPTDTIYAIGCDITKHRAVEQIAAIKGLNLKKANFSIICYDLSDLSNYCKPVNTPVYKLMRKSLPGPYTFILNASNAVPKLFQSNKKTIGIRVPDNSIPREIVRMLGNPIVSTSVHSDDEITEYHTDPELIHESIGNKVEIVIDGGYGDNTASTVIDCTGDEPVLIREGKGEFFL